VFPLLRSREKIIPAAECAAIDMMLGTPSMKQAALKGIKDAITNAHTPATEPGRIKGEEPLFFCEQ
tara:strand:+ start:141 stop:338 length:198 start_codon:yes stop_codon:yes gene_type:complete